MADTTLVSYFRRFLTERADVEGVYQQAFAAYNERALEVVVTSAAFEGGSSHGQIVGDPKELMDVCELILAEMDADDEGDSLAAGPSHVDFSKGILET